MSESEILKETRARLEAEKAKHWDAMEGQLLEITTEAKRWGRTVVIVGATLWVTYKVVSGIITSKKPGKEAASNTGTGTSQAAKAENALVVAKNKQEPMLLRLFKEQIAEFLIMIAKQKLAQFLESFNSIDDADGGETEERDS